MLFFYQAKTKWGNEKTVIKKLKTSLIVWYKEFLLF